MKLTQFLLFHIFAMQECFNLCHFMVEVKESKAKSLQSSTLFEIEVDYEYMEAVIRYGKVAKSLWHKDNEEKLLLGLAHELTHILTGEIKGINRNKAQVFYDERATEQISRLLYRLYKRRK